MPKYCPNCGKQTLYETDESDCDAGDKWDCYSCGFVMWMSESEPLDYTAKNGKVEPYQPIKTDMEVFLEKAWRNIFLQAFSEERSLYNDVWVEMSSKPSETVTFRRYKPFTDISAESNQI